MVSFNIPLIYTYVCIYLRCDLTIKMKKYINSQAIIISFYLVKKKKNEKQASKYFNLISLCVV